MSSNSKDDSAGAAQGSAAPTMSVGITTDNQTNAAERRAKGEFVRGVSSVRHWIGTSPQYPAEAGRYHLYVAKNCPWCHRVLLGRAVLGLTAAITVDVLFPNRSNDDEPRGGGLWKFCPEGQTGQNHRFVSFPSCTADTVHGKRYVKEIYEMVGVQDQKSVPILYDKKTKTIVNNESAEILRMMGTAMRHLGQHSDKDNTTAELYPADKAGVIDELNDWIYTDVANGSYKAGFSSNQDTYEEAYRKYFAALDRLDTILADNRFLVGDSVTEADLRLFPPLFRMDPVYYTRFKLNKHFLWHYRNLWRWMGDMMALPGMEEDGVADQEYLQHCKQGYFGRTGNGTVPVGPEGYPECYREPHWSHETK